MIQKNNQSQNTMYKYRFYKDNQGWFIDYPEHYERGGSKAELAMVAGADKMLDAISDNGEEVTVEFSDSPFDGHDICLRRILRDPWGATYNIDDKAYPNFVWLCNVTKAVFNGPHPKHIYMKKVRDEEV